MFDFHHFAIQLAWLGTALALLNAAALVLERTAFASAEAWQRRMNRRYGPMVRRALDGDRDAVRGLVNSPRRHHVAIGWMLVTPLYDDRDPSPVARAGAIIRAMSLFGILERWARSHWWWRRARGVRALGLLRVTTHTHVVVAALDDSHVEVRAAALDSLADLCDPRALMAVVVRLNDESLHYGRRFAAIAAYGGDIEPFLLEVAAIDPANQLNYARALGICGTTRALPTLSRWTRDSDASVRAAALRALGRIELDADSASLALDALEADDVTVRAMAAYALRKWPASDQAAARLGRHLDDVWPVAVQAAQSLKTMHERGIATLQAAAARPDLAGRLARQTLWDTTARC